MNFKIVALLAWRYGPYLITREAAGEHHVAYVTFDQNSVMTLVLVGKVTDLADAVELADRHEKALNQGKPRTPEDDQDKCGDPYCDGTCRN